MTTPTYPTLAKPAARPPQVARVSVATLRAMRRALWGVEPAEVERLDALHVYNEPGRGWYCFGCGRGGSIYDLAALLSGRSSRGRDFVALRRELEG